MYIAILGRQSALSVAELERLYGASSVGWVSDQAALVRVPSFDFERLGGTQKAGRVVAELNGAWRDVSRKIVTDYTAAWQQHDGKITLGISAYGFDITPREVQKAGIMLKAKLKQHGVSLRLIPNLEPALNTAASHHNKLGLSSNKVELLVVRGSNGRVYVAESVGAQNITALAARDQARPKTDAFVGMLPPKLARIMINLATGDTAPSADFTILDPFCGTGVILQEALLLGYSAYGSDINPKMVTYTSENLDWLRKKYDKIFDYHHGVSLGDATTTQWEQSVLMTGGDDVTLVPMRINAVASETYLGQPFSAPPSPSKLVQVRDNCNHIISTFLANLHGQIDKGTPVCIAVPAWRDNDGHFTHLPFIRSLDRLGYSRITLSHVRDDQLLYYRENQVVARELLILTKQ